MSAVNTDKYTNRRWKNVAAIVDGAHMFLEPAVAIYTALQSKAVDVLSSITEEASNAHV